MNEMFGYELRKRLEAVKMGIVWGLPRWVIYWAVIRASATVTLGDENPTTVTVNQLLKRFHDASTLVLLTPQEES